MAAETADVIVVGAGLAGLVAAAELADAGKEVLLVEQESSLGGQAFWSFGGLFLVGSPEQRRLGVRDSVDLAWDDWQAFAGFDRPEDNWPRQWARAYVEFAAGEKRAWLKEHGLRFFPIVGWAERAGNSVPRFHVTWGTGPAVVEPFVRRVREAAERGRINLRFRHRVDELVTTDHSVTGVRGVLLEPSTAPCGQSSSRTPVGEFELSAQAVLVAAGGIGGNHDLVRANWPSRLGDPPATILSGVPAHVDGRMLGISEAAGANLVNRDRMWHYVEGVTNWSPVWPAHGVRILPGPSSLWLDAKGRRLPAPLYPGFDTLATLEHLRRTGYDYSWFVLDGKIIEREFSLSGSEQNPDLTNKDVKLTLRRALPGPPGPVAEFMRHGEDFVVADNLDDLVAGMNRVTGSALLSAADIRTEIVARDQQIDSRYGRDPQITAIRNARRYLGDRLIRVAAPHRFAGRGSGPFIAVRLSIVSRKTLGGLETDLRCRVLRPGGTALPGLYAAGEATGFGGGGMHGYRSLEGTFLGGCLFTGRQAGRAIASVL
ncbi:FAD-binding dehydrogenase [Amycolatopsis sp. NPDC059090]|uniref:FAD-binding dehydrogenase n=1 Tax=unclassified Amycolatopsis TaxID=2618356 RepID=UPI00367347B7